jgi:hypothetical protein
VPPFNAQKLLALAGADGVPVEEAAGAEPDAEVSYVTRDLARVAARQDCIRLSIDDVIARVRDTANWTGGSQSRYQVASLPPGTAPLAYAADGTPDPYAGFETRIVPENITCCRRPASSDRRRCLERTAPHRQEGRDHRRHPGEAGATPEEISQIAQALGPRGRPNGLKEGQRLRILLSSIDDPNRLQPIRVIVMGDSAIEAVVALVRARPLRAGRRRNVMNTMVSESGAEEDDGKGMRLYQSIYETALRNNIPRPVIEA